MQGPCRRSSKRIVQQTRNLVTITVLAQNNSIAPYAHGPKCFTLSPTTCRPSVCDTEPGQSPLAAVVQRQTRVGDVEALATTRPGEVNGSLTCYLSIRHSIMKNNLSEFYRVQSSLPETCRCREETMASQYPCRLRHYLTTGPDKNLESRRSLLDR